MAEEKKKSSHKEPPTEKEIQKTVEEAEDLKDNPEEEEEPESESPEVDTPPDEETEEEEETPPETPEEEPEPKEVEEESPIEPKPKPEPKEEPDYKKKFTESARENQKILAKNRKINEAIDKGAEIPEPTEEEMIAEYGENWDMMDDVQKKFAREARVASIFRQSLIEARKEGQKIEKWNEKVSKFAEDPETLVKFPGLEGNLEEFKIYASEERHAGISFDVLIPAFLHESEETPNKKKKKEMFPTSTPGPETPREDGKLTLEEGRRLRTTDYEKWKRLVKEGKIKINL